MINIIPKKQQMNKRVPSIFVMPRMEALGDKHHSIRLIIPGIDGGGAVHLDGEVCHESIEACEELAKRCIAELGKTEFRETI